ncbi:MAG: ferritin-like domain-containing protein [Candidatus Kariarchaeaceae archaeon]
MNEEEVYRASPKEILRFLSMSLAMKEAGSLLYQEGIETRELPSDIKEVFSQTAKNEKEAANKIRERIAQLGQIEDRSIMINALVERSKSVQDTKEWLQFLLDGELQAKKRYDQQVGEVFDDDLTKNLLIELANEEEELCNKITVFLENM